MTKFAPMPEPPYYAVIFANQASADLSGYDVMAEAMVAQASSQPGFLGIDSTRAGDGFGITISYWKDETSIRNWRDNLGHMAAQKLGMERWYDHYTLRIAKVERQYEGPEGRSARQ
ncbi:MAG: antibiotic biosynthesis monooxygenase [Paracoccaceae bacterium]|jgi:heme-degrading monooxygenase HmoA|nr:antibiotic biosynthesis monooxygenase [Paracoccaceae bacterium]MDP7184314.1 antibiotic biosynthesis monooxygenase [Paracoccaceae bacterium]